MTPIEFSDEDRSLKPAWERLDQGVDKIEDWELAGMIRQLKLALPYLHARMPLYSLVIRDTYETLNRLENFLASRANK
jgi:hypothetical protein